MHLTITTLKTRIYPKAAQSWQKVRFLLCTVWLLRGPHGFFFFLSHLCSTRLKTGISITPDQIQKYFVQCLGKGSCRSLNSERLVGWGDNHFLE